MEITAKTLMIVAIITVVVCFTFAVKSRFYDNSISNLIIFTEQQQEIDMLKFCLKHDIKTCDTETVKTWNEEHPDQVFVFKEFHDIVDQAIEDTKLYSKQRPLGI